MSVKPGRTQFAALSPDSHLRMRKSANASSNRESASSRIGRGVAKLKRSQVSPPGPNCSPGLAKMRARGVEPDPAEARRWYEMAQKLGSGEAAQQLERLARDE